MTWDCELCPSTWSVSQPCLALLLSLCHLCCLPASIVVHTDSGEEWSLTCLKQAENRFLGYWRSS